MTLDSDQKEVIIAYLTEPGVLERWSAGVLASFRLLLYSNTGVSPEKGNAVSFSDEGLPLSFELKYVIPAKAGIQKN
jgi:hypothetical protein